MTRSNSQKANLEFSASHWRG